MGKAKLKKKLLGIQKQRKKHIDKFREAFDRGDERAMNYMAREIKDYSEISDKFSRRLLPKSKKKVISSKNKQ